MIDIKNKLNIIKQDYLNKLQEHLNVKQYLLVEQILDQYNLLIEANLEPDVPDEIPDLEISEEPPIELENKRLKERVAQLETSLNHDISKFRHIESEPLRVSQPPSPPDFSTEKMDVQEMNTPEVEEEEDFNDENLELVDDPEYDEKGINKVPIEKSQEVEKPKISLQERIKMMHEARKNKVKTPKAPNIYH